MTLKFQYLIFFFFNNETMSLFLGEKKKNIWTEEKKSLDNYNWKAKKWTYVLQFLKQTQAPNITGR